MLFFFFQDTHYKALYVHSSLFLSINTFYLVYRLFIVPPIILLSMYFSNFLHLYIIFSLCFDFTHSYWCFLYPLSTFIVYFYFFTISLKSPVLAAAPDSLSINPCKLFFTILPFYIPVFLTYLRTLTFSININRFSSNLRFLHTIFYITSMYSLSAIMLYVTYYFLLVSFFIISNSLIYFVYSFYYSYYYLPVLAAAPDIKHPFSRISPANPPILPKNPRELR